MRTVNWTLLQVLCANCAEYLQRKFPDYAWGLRPSVDGSMIEIRAFVPDVDQSFGYRYKTQKLQPYTGRDKLLLNAAGEILERFNLARHRKTDVSEVTRPRNARLLIQPED